MGTGRSAQDPQADIPRDPQWGAGTSSCCSHDVRGRRAGACAGPTLALECSRPPARALWTPRGSAPVPEPRQKPLPPGPYAQHPEPQRTQRVGVQTQQSRGGGCEGHSTELGAPDGDAIPDTGRPAGGPLGPPRHGPSHRGVPRPPGGQAVTQTPDRTTRAPRARMSLAVTPTPTPEPGPGPLPVAPTPEPSPNGNMASGDTSTRARTRAHARSCHSHSSTRSHTHTLTRARSHARSHSHTTRRAP